MDICKIAAAGFVGAVLTVVLKEEKSPYSMLAAAMTCIAIFVFVLPNMAGIVQNITEISEDVSIYSDYIEVMIKALAVAYISMFSSQLCRDFGQSSIGDKIELGGKIIILVSAMSVMDGLVEKILMFME